jgi:flagellar biosynthetic protein FliR
VTAALLLADVALGLVARSVPQLNVFVVGAPAKVAAGLAMLAVTVPITVAIMGRSFGSMVDVAARLLQGG